MSTGRVLRLVVGGALVMACASPAPGGPAPPRPSPSSAANLAKAKASGRKVAMRCQISVVERKPLSLLVSLLNPASAAEALWVPRELRPLGAFVSVEIKSQQGEVVWATTRPKFTPKVSPAKPEAYLALEPGEAWGRVFGLDETVLARGSYVLRVDYSNLSFKGFPGRDLGEQRCSATLALEVD